MARMFPDEPAENTRSPAERKLFPRIRDETPDSWVALHSLGLKGHSRKLWAEADFVLVTSLGVWVLEVKGGRIQRHDRQWFQNGKDMGESPFEQGAGAAGALRKDLFDNLPQARGACVANAVAFPDVEFDADGPDIDRDLVYDNRDLARPFKSFVEQVADFHDRTTSRRSFRELSRGNISAIVHRLAGDFDLVPSLRSHVDEVAVELFKLTEQQRACVAGFADDPRATVIGSAGTGKTLLAVSEAKRLAEGGQRVLLCCLNARLAENLALAVDGHPGVMTVCYHAWQRSMVRETARTGDLPDASEAELRRTYLPLVAIEAFEDLGHERFDALVVDEAQDLLLSEHLEFLDAVLQGELDHGCWRFFLDPYQDVHGGAADPARHRLEDLGRSFKLLINCRNTMPIAMAATSLARRRLTTVLSPDGKPVVDRWYGGRKEQRKELGRLLTEWLSANLRPEQIAVLSTRPLEASAVRDGLPDGVPAELWERGSGAPRPKNGIEFAEITDFKGLEATAVVVLDVDDLESAAARATVYVAASRATTLLGVFYAKRVEPAYQAAAEAFGQRLRAAPL